ncbi:MAG: glycosyltransferase family 2 protein, partial [Lachnospiraceae bacterium]|nr:glycosyltransferase family 2 protein [Lachnospiraceae bacterium]
VTWLLFLFFRIRVPDANVPFRLMRADVVEDYLHRLPSDYNLPNIMLTTFFKYYGCKVGYNRISFSGRSAGKNSINIFKIFSLGFKALGDFSRFAGEMKKDSKGGTENGH